MICISREIENGNYTARITLRKGDEGRPLAAQLNNTCGSIDKRLSQIKKWAFEKQPEEAIILIQKELSTIQTQKPPS